MHTKKSKSEIKSTIQEEISNDIPQHLFPYDVGHTMFFGPTGAGKSTLISLIPELGKLSNKN